LICCISFFGWRTGHTLIQIVWEFMVRDGKASEFEKFYSATGPWATLFGGSPGFLGTTLLRDTGTARRYLTVDRWDSAASHRAMHGRLAKQYQAMDRDCQALTETEQQIGVFEDLESR
jgi:heme-degrading monooxygenase HmoA